MQVHLVSVENGSKIADIDAGSYVAASVTVSGNQAFLGNYAGMLICIDLTQRKIVWEYSDKEDGAPFFSSPAVNEQRVVIGSRGGGLHCVDRNSGRKIWSFNAGGDIDSSPVICGDKVVFGCTDGRIYMGRWLEPGEEGTVIRSGSKRWGILYVVLMDKDKKEYCLAPGEFEFIKS